MGKYFWGCVCTLACLVCFLLYAGIGTSGDVDEIKSRAPGAIAERGWDLLRYEGFQYGSFSSHGGKVWYHVQNTDDHSIQYRVFITLWDDELQFYYKEPELLNRMDIKIDQ